MSDKTIEDLLRDGNDIAVELCYEVAVETGTPVGELRKVDIPGGQTHLEMLLTRKFRDLETRIDQLEERIESHE